VAKQAQDRPIDPERALPCHCRRERGEDRQEDHDTADDRPRATAAARGPAGHDIEPWPSLPDAHAGPETRLEVTAFSSPVTTASTCVCAMWGYSGSVTIRSATESVTGSACRAPWLSA
jgi:hypothetical protein